MSAVDIKPLRYPATCVRCGTSLLAKTRANWDKARREATCEPCATGEYDRGTPGASAAREGKRRHERRVSRVRSSHPRIGGVLLALVDDPQSTRAWFQGSSGERLLGESLERLRADSFGVLHDRKLPGTKTNIDHLVVGPAGVFVIDAKRYKGKVDRRDRGSFIKRDWRLYVNGRDQSALITAMQRQVDAVKNVLESSPFDGCPVFPVLCFVEAEWGMLPSPLTFGDVRVMWPKMLAKCVRGHGPLVPDRIMELERTLAVRLPAA